MQGNTYTDQNQQLFCCEAIVLIVAPGQCNSLVNLSFRAGSVQSTIRPGTISGLQKEDTILTVI